jgi:hypothetical protein
MISFEPSEDQRMMTDQARTFAKSLRLRMREAEAAREVPAELRKTAIEMGLGSVAIPESLGGAGLGLATASLIEQELAAGDVGAAFGLPGPGAFGRAVAELADPPQAMRALSLIAEDGFGAVAWGERAPHPTRPGLSAIARREGDGWVLSGQKAYVLNAGRASAFVVFAQVDESLGWAGLGAFIVASDAPGVQVGPRETTLGLDVASVADVTFNDVRVAASERLGEGANFDAATLRFFVKNALIMASRAVGLSRAAVDVTRDYVEQRKAFGKPVGHFQAVAFNVADRAMDVAASSAMVLRAAWMWDAGVPEGEALLASAFAVSFALEAAMRCGDDAVQLHGGAGFIRDYPVEKMMRDAKQLQLAGMPSGCADQLAAAVELGRPLDLGLVLPNAESQSALV